VSSTRRPRPTPAAGGVLWRADGSSLLVALAHRPRYDDWTLPKGKLEGAERPLLAAVREVAEETGAAVEVGRRLATVEYPIGGVPKRVSYWAMRYRDGEHCPNDEVDQISWLTVAEATQRVTYPIDRGVLADFARLPAASTSILLMRHTKAGKRSDYRGEDRLRPLDKIGRRQAWDSVKFLQAFNPQRILAADRTRCEQTVQPLAERLGIERESAPEFSDEAYAEEPRRTMKSFVVLAAAGRTSVVCSQGNAIPGLLDDLNAPTGVFPCRKGSVWVLSTYRGSVIAADYYPYPAV
jgi:8-oxo-dGTP pyrophosphatase MutT (NUDIX family)/phosphohistidine phosphatase SixA